MESANPGITFIGAFDRLRLRSTNALLILSPTIKLSTSRQSRRSLLWPQTTCLHHSEFNFTSPLLRILSLLFPNPIILSNLYPVLDYSRPSIRNRCGKFSVEGGGCVSEIGRALIFLGFFSPSNLLLPLMLRLHAFWIQ